MATPRYSHSVFLNVPFDDKYRTMFEALVFAVHDCGFVARSAFESDDATQVRLAKLFEIIGSSKYGIHDISCTSVDGIHRLPRFNMPFELGLFMGVKQFGGLIHSRKRGLVLDRERYRYQIFCSDIAGQDIRAHNNRPSDAIRSVRNWLRASPDTRGKKLPGADYIYRRYQAFRYQLPRLRKHFNLDQGDLDFVDYTSLVVGWLKANP
ncbi:MAG: hypothetical protein A3F68_00015 [Acidobacteria bacterium RIFCSPLOWO2_12_FULL_54_10]|nr:MAG: hypothetical protein A3F68_00015 [Acidobacteria bacterium RIFCSPLOWO2_12_FULL_54_10]